MPTPLPTTALWPKRHADTDSARSLAQDTPAPPCYPCRMNANVPPDLARFAETWRRAGRALAELPPDETPLQEAVRQLLPLFALARSVESDSDSPDGLVAYQRTMRKLHDG